MILLIDNYDSFSYNLYQLVGSIRTDIRVIRNDEMTVEEIRQLARDRENHPMPESASRLSGSWEQRSRSLVYAWDIRQSVRYTVCR